MDIRKPGKKKKSEVKPEVISVDLKEFKAGLLHTADAKVILPPAIQGKLTALSQKYGLSFDLSNIGLDGKMADNIKAIRAIADMVEGDSKLLPEMMKQIRRLMRAEIKLAQFHKLVVKESIKHQVKLDKQTADIFLAMSGYQSKTVKLEHRTNVRNELKLKRTNAYANHYKNSVYGDESEIIDAEFAILESNRKILTASKTKKMETLNNRKQKIEAYVQSTFTE